MVSSCAQRRLDSDCADAQADSSLSLGARWKVRLLTLRLTWTLNDSHTAKAELSLWRSLSLQCSYMLYAVKLFYFDWHVMAMVNIISGW